MLTQPLADNEAIRLIALEALEVLDTAPEAEFDAIAQAAALALRTPIALISLIDAERQWFKAGIGLPGIKELPRARSFCASTLLADETVVIDDVHLDARFAENPLVVNPPHVRFYAGVALLTHDGHRIGTLSVMDQQPRILDEWQRRLLRCLGDAAVSAFEGRQSRLQARKAKNALAAIDARFRALSESSPNGVFYTDADNNCIYANERCLSILGLSLPECLGQGWLSTLQSPDRARLTAGLAEAIARRGECSLELHVDHPDGDVRQIQVRTRILPTADNSIEGLIGTIDDVTVARRLTEKLAEQHELLSVTLRSIADAVITIGGDGRITWLNHAAEQLTGWTAGEAAAQPFGQVFQTINDQTRTPEPDPLAPCLTGGNVVVLDEHSMLISRSGGEYGIQATASPICNDGHQVLGAVLVFRDVTEQRRQTREMSYQATHDALTGLINRVEFERCLQRVLQSAHQEHRTHSLMFIDLDHFKAVNDSCGHSAGDLVLQQVTKMLTESVRARDVVARLGGDEFAIVLEYCTPEQAERIAQKICERMGDYQFVHDQHRFHVGTSIGIVPIDERWTSTAALQNAADAGCYAAKEGGRNRCHVWKDSDRDDMTTHGDAQWSARLAQALEDGHFVLHAQRILPTSAAPAPLAAELLVRMKAADGSLVMPDAFLSAAQRFHLASRIDRWVIAEAITQLGMQSPSKAIDYLSINLSGDSVGDRAFHRWIADLLQQTGSTICHRLCLEIPETVILTMPIDAADLIRQLRPFGLRFAIDDFGAGAASFTYLKSMTVDYLKIDSQFIRNLPDDRLNETAIRGFVDIARTLGVRTIAKGIESRSVAEHLGRMHIGFVQGFALHRPEPIDDVLPPAIAQDRLNKLDDTPASATAVAHSPAS